LASVQQTRLRLQDVTVTPVGPATLAIAAGQCVSLASPSGSGKTRLLRAVADLIEHAGQVYLDGRECNQWEAPAWRRLVGYLPADSHWWSDRVEDHFERVDAPWLGALGLAEAILQRRVDRLSSGQRQRLALLRLLGNRPKVLLLDEPTANLDPDNAGRVEDLIEGYRLHNGAAVIWVAHDPAQCLRVASEHFTLSDGALVPVTP